MKLVSQFSSLRPGHHRWISLALGLLAFGVYNANMRLVTATDNYPARFLPFAILGHGTLYFDPIIGAASQGQGRPGWLKKRQDHYVSQYPVVTPVLVTPLYVPAMLYLQWRGWTDHRATRIARFMEKISASFIVSLSVALLYLLLLRRVSPGVALLVTIAYALGTNTWMTSSQGLWQHGTAELFLVLILLLLTRPSTIARSLAVGALCALVAFNRPPDALLAGPLGFFSLWWAGRRLWPFVVAGGLVPAALLLAYNLLLVGPALGGYAAMASSHSFHYNVLFGLGGLLVSPARGLLIYSCFLLAIPIGLPRALRDPAWRPLTITICIAFVLQIFLYARADWLAGVCYGPRFLTDVLPLLAWLLAPAVEAMGIVPRAAFCLAVAVSIAIQAVGAFWYTGKSDEAIYSHIGDPLIMSSAWKWENAPFLLEPQHGHATHDLLLNVQGGIDSVKAGGRDATEALPGAAIEVAGWASANRRSPSNVLAILSTRRPRQGHGASALTRVFLPRPGVTGRPLGWSLTLETAGLKPGDYLIETYAQGGEGGEYLPVAQVPFTLLPAQDGN